MLDPDQQNRIVTLINRLIKCLASKEVAVDERHTPKLYSRFLEGLLLRRNQLALEEEQRRAEEAAGPEPTSNIIHSTPSTNGPVVTIKIPVPSTTNSASAPERLMSPTIAVHAPEDSGAAGPSLSYDPNLPTHPAYLDENMAFDEQYDHSATASSTVDALSHYTNEDVPMPGGDDWTAAMSAIYNPAYWSDGGLPGYFPSPDMAGWGLNTMPTTELNHEQGMYSNGASQQPQYYGNGSGNSMH